MGVWSAENATKAYLKTMKMGKGAKQPDVAEFISALAAGNTARLILVACAAAAGADSTAAATTRALVAAAQQTGGRVVSVLSSADELRSCRTSLGEDDDDAKHVEFILGDAEALLRNEYREADCVVVDCNLKNSEAILETARRVGKPGAMVLGYNALCMASSRRCQGLNAHLLPIGEGVLVARRGGSAGKGKSRWIVTVDEGTGEEHVFRVRSSSSTHGRKDG
ncbi:PREDICTED: uncharacterized protein LOC109186352 [Ipomoea nil]|uniref:uncharacterized protein LOC109186352 n=1 Tax=Ipomoea nil TaxID=35883 RepID=UPI000901A8DA|nr:PREDICTED: uncharacterized protein LOC109186352 [Ipomoea nil]